MNNIVQKFRSLWELVIIDKVGTVLQTSLTSKQESITIGSPIAEVLPWFRLDWLTGPPCSRLIKGSLNDRFLIEIYPEKDKYLLFFRNINEYRNVEHLWCEIYNEIISVQKFIDASYDGVFVADGAGNILAVNNSFCQISGIERNKMIGKNCQDLTDKGLHSYSCTLKAIETKALHTGLIKYPKGREAIVTARPIMNKNGRIVRVIANVRDVTELNKLQEKLQNATALAKGFQRELKTIQEVSKNPYIRLTRSSIMNSLYGVLTKVANTDLQLLISGSSGVGKTALAKLVHAMSERNKTGSFIHINCSAIPETLLEAELFGYEEGSFTGADKRQVGLFELAHNGTLFLDEIGDMPLCLQSKILNVLQEGYFYRVGGRKQVNINTRIIAATNAQIEKKIETGQFREDLYYRLNVVPIYVPRLAERREDIPPLISYYVNICNKRYGKSTKISAEVMEVLIKYDWPGNIRELINLIERLIVIVDDSCIELKHLPKVNQRDILKIIPTISSQGNAVETEPLLRAALWRPNVPLKQLVSQVEAEIIEEALAHSGSLKDTAKNLQVDVTTLIRKRHRYCKRNPEKLSKKVLSYNTYKSDDILP